MSKLGSKKASEKFEQNFEKELSLQIDSQLLSIIQGRHLATLDSSLEIRDKYRYR